MMRLLARLLCGIALASSVFSQESVRSGVEKVVISRKDGQNLELYKGGSYALLLGNSNYQYWDKLVGVETDILEIDRSLKSQGFLVETALNLESEALEKRVSKFINEYGYIDDSRLIIYFAGHGDTQRLSDGREVGYIIPVDAPKFSQNERGFKQKAISLTNVENWARRMDTKHALFVFDSCFSGTLLTRSDLSLPPVIEEYLSKPARQFLTSGSANQKVSDDSYFRRVFVEGLGGEADKNFDGFITATELAYFLKERVTNYTRRSQTPLYGAINDLRLNQGDMIFRVPAEFRAKNALRAEQAWRSVVMNDPDELKRFIANYPGSPQAEEARGLLKKLSSPNQATRAATPVEVAPAPLSFRTYDYATVSIDSRGAEARSSKVAKFFAEPVGDGDFLTMVEIPAGRFKMGSADNNEEKPVREVPVYSFFASAYEITQKQWRFVSKLPKVNMTLFADPSSNRGDSLPVENISWEEAKEFCLRLSKLTGKKYDLPSEAEWEYMAGGGSSGPFAFGAKLTGQIANYDASNRLSSVTLSQGGISRGGTIPVGSLKVANGFGLFDVHGNVAEWCLDTWHSNYIGAPSDASPRLTESKRRVIRGGSYKSLATDVRTGYRGQAPHDETFPDIGFRIVVRGL